MKKESFVIIMIAVLFLAISILMIYTFNLSYSSSNTDLDAEKNLVINQQLNAENYCNSYNEDYPCFDYEELEQTEGNGNFYVPEQVKKEPCEKPRVVCKLCFEYLEQQKGRGDMNIVEQARENC